MIAQLNQGEFILPILDSLHKEWCPTDYVKQYVVFLWVKIVYDKF